MALHQQSEDGKGYGCDQIDHRPHFTVKMNWEEWVIKKRDCSYQFGKMTKA
jgi:hypothetical protein